MKAAVSVSVIVGSATGALGVTTQCSAGRVHKDDLSGLLCMSNVNNAASCDSECCKNDANTCGGINAKKAIQCEFDEYKAGDDAWAKTVATEKNAKTVCCAKKATCAEATCPAGYEANVDAAGQHCTSDAKGCADSKEGKPISANSAKAKCCKITKLTCFGQYLSTGTVVANQKCKVGYGNSVAGSTKLEDDTWAKTPITGKADFPNKCCTALPKCSDKAKYTCPAGKKVTTVPADLAKTCTNSKGKDTMDFKDCGRDDTKTPKETPSKNACCVADAATCYGLSSVLNPPAVAGQNVACTTGYLPKNRYEVKPGGSMKQKKFDTDCCVPKATCKDAKCPAGYKAKQGVGAIPCAGDADSCVKDAAGTVLLGCCQVDAATCGGQTDMNCAYGFFNEQTMWNADTKQTVMDAWNAKPGNATNKNTNCCTARAICDVTATTTPLPTFTPAAPALKYSVHKDLKAKQESSKMMWLAGGAIAGMSIMMLVQRMRSTPARRVQRDVQEAEEDLLIDEEQ